MELMSRSSTASGLNPNAPPYIPCRYRAVEDYSPEWWELVRSSPWFQDYWLRECFYDFEEADQQNTLDVDEIYDPVLPDLDSVFHSYHSSSHQDERKMEIMRWGAEKWHGGRNKTTDVPQKLLEKVPKIVSFSKVISLRKIHQPR